MIIYHNDTLNWAATKTKLQNLFLICWQAQKLNKNHGSLVYFILNDFKIGEKIKDLRQFKGWKNGSYATKPNTKTHKLFDRAYYIGNPY